MVEKEFLVLHVKDEHDLHLFSRNRDDILSHLKEIFYSIVGTNLPIYSIEGQTLLDKFVKTKQHVKLKKSVSLPDGKFLDLDQDIYAAVEEGVF